MMVSHPSGYPQVTGMSGLHPMPVLNHPVYSVQQQQQQQQQQQMSMYGPGAQQQQIMQPAPVQGMSQMTWMQGGVYGPTGQWRG